MRSSGPDLVPMTQFAGTTDQCLVKSTLEDRRSEYVQCQKTAPSVRILVEISTDQGSGPAWGRCTWPVRRVISSRGVGLIAKSE